MNKYNDASTLPPEEYHGLPRPKQRLPLAPTDAAGWASRAFHASLSSEKALQQATLPQRAGHPVGIDGILFKHY